MRMGEHKAIFKEWLNDDRYKHILLDVLNSKEVYNINLGIQTLVNSPDFPVQDSEQYAISLLNMRSILSEIPELPFRIGVSADEFSRAGGFSSVGSDTYLKEISHSSRFYYIMEVVASGNQCEDIRISRDFDVFSISSDQSSLTSNPKFLRWFLENDDSLTDVKSLLLDMGMPFNPRVYSNIENYFYETMQDYLTGITDEMF